jgi:hypothetical protein
MQFQARSTKQVILYSTKHHKAEVGRSGKPTMIEEYNETKFGIDIFDEMCQHYAYLPPVRRWPMRVFMHLCNAAAINAHVLYKGKDSRRDFISDLADQLMDEHKKTREKESEANFWMNKAFREISALFDNLHNKLSGKKRSA